MRLNDLPGLIQPPLRREFPWLVLQVCLLVVLLHANAPEVWFWFAAALAQLDLASQAPAGPQSGHQ